MKKKKMKGATITEDAEGGETRDERKRGRKKRKDEESADGNM